MYKNFFYSEWLRPGFCRTLDEKRGEAFGVGAAASSEEHTQKTLKKEYIAIGGALFTQVLQLKSYHYNDTYLQYQQVRRATWSITGRGWKWPLFEVGEGDGVWPLPSTRGPGNSLELVFRDKVRWLILCRMGG